MIKDKEAAAKSMEETLELIGREELLQQSNPVAIESLAILRGIARHLLSLNRPN